MRNTTGNNEVTKIAEIYNQPKFSNSYNWLSLDPEDAIYSATKKYSQLSSQLAFLEATRWGKLTFYKIVNDEEKLQIVCSKYNANTEAVKKILTIIQEKYFIGKNSKTTITRKDIKAITGLPAIDTMKAVCEILEIPVSLRGINYARKMQKNYHANGKPVHFANDKNHKFH